MFVAERLDVEAFPRNVAPETILVNTGLADTAIVEVDESTIFDPAVKNVLGEL